jgi:peptidoglycan hydrolase CwlO-like protein
MEILSLIISAAGLFIAGANVMIFCIIKFNDLSHLQKGQEEIKSTLDDIKKKVGDTAERISNVEGKCKANHG